MQPLHLLFFFIFRAVFFLAPSRIRSSMVSRMSNPLWMRGIFLGSLTSLVSCQEIDEQDAIFEEGRETKKSPLHELFGQTLYILGYDTDKETGKEQKVVFEAELSDLVKDSKVIGVYFSASWCAPCRQFTPILAKFYEEMKKQGKKLEIVWVSRDQTSEDFLQYFAKMPWLAVPMQQVQSVYEQLAPLYQVKGIPHLVFIDAKTGEVISLDGRTQVLKDPYGLEFPWRSRSLLNIIPSSLKSSIRQYLGKVQQRLAKLLWSLLDGFLSKSVFSKQRLSG